MTEIRFLTEPALHGFEIKGHSSSDSEDDTGRLVCAAVSSAAYMAANTITEVIGDQAEITVDDAVMKLSCPSPSASTVATLEGLRLHLSQLAGQYNKNIRIYGGVKPC